jgi:DNA mismatch repair ATPase MutS
MVSGKLDEELSRMSIIADALRPRCLVLFNESFSATNEREGSEIARQTVRALLDSDIRVFFVTHLFDLAESFRIQASPSTLFLRAERQVDGRRSFKLVEGDALSTSYGEDLYQMLFPPDEALDDSRENDAQSEDAPTNT